MAANKTTAVLSPEEELLENLRDPNKAFAAASKNAGYGTAPKPTGQLAQGASDTINNANAAMAANGAFGLSGMRTAPTPGLMPGGGPTAPAPAAIPDVDYLPRGPVAPVRPTTAVSAAAGQPRSSIDLGVARDRLVGRDQEAIKRMQYIDSQLDHGPASRDPAMAAALQGQRAQLVQDRAGDGRGTLGYNSRIKQIDTATHEPAMPMGATAESLNADRANLNEQGRNYAVGRIKGDTAKLVDPKTPDSQRAALYEDQHQAGQVLTDFQNQRSLPPRTDADARRANESRLSDYDRSKTRQASAEQEALRIEEAEAASRGFNSSMLSSQRKLAANTVGAEVAEAGARKNIADASSSPDYLKERNAAELARMQGETAAAQAGAAKQKAGAAAANATAAGQQALAPLNDPRITQATESLTGLISAGPGALLADPVQLSRMTSNVAQLKSLISSLAPEQQAAVKAALRQQLGLPKPRGLSPLLGLGLGIPGVLTKYNNDTPYYDTVNDLDNFLTQ